MNPALKFVAFEISTPLEFPLTFPQLGNRGSCIHLLGVDVYFDEYNYHVSLQARLVEGIGSPGFPSYLVLLFQNESKPFV